MVLAAAIGLFAAAGSFAQPVDPPLRLLDVPFIQQSEALCGGAAAAMVMRYWGATGIRAESFGPLVDEAARGIRADDLLRDLRGRGWEARSFRGDRALVAARLARRQPVVALIEDRPGYFHFVVIVAWTNGRVLYHDPARAPFRVIDEQRFDAAWQKSDRWTMLVLPPSNVVAASAGTETKDAAAVKTPCDDLVAEGVRAAEAGDRTAAVDVFTAAAELCPNGSAPLRESAGVFALEGKWTEAERLAREAVGRDATDAHAWRIIATSAYLRGDATAALQAWNAVGEPIIDLVNVLGLDRTRHSVATALIDLDADRVLTARGLAAAAKRLRDLPSAEVATINYRPLGGGRAAVEAVVVERSMLPTSRASLAGTAVRLGTDRELAASVAGPTGGGELFSASWRWWRNRPRLELSLASPSRAGIWRATAFAEEQAYGESPASFTERRRGGSLALSRWTTTMTRVEIGGGVDTWGRDQRTVSVRADVDQRLLDDRVSIRAGASMFAGSFDARTMSVVLDWRSRVRHEGLAVLGSVGAAAVSKDARRALWVGAGTGTGRDPLLRAHPLLDDGRIDGEVFGRRLVHGSAEARRWVKPILKVVRLAPAVYVDVAAADRRLHPGPDWHIDAGAGLRLALPGAGVLRVDVAKGLRDGATAVSVGWVR